MNAKPKTMDEHLEYLFEIVKLKLFFLARWQNEHPEEEFSFILRNRVDIFRKTDINPEGLVPVGEYFELPRWQALEKRLFEIYTMVKGDEKCFEEWGFDYLRPCIERRCERDFYDVSRITAYQCGFLRHNPAPNEDGKTLGFHIANDRTPDSFFSDPEHIKECFGKLMDVAEQRFKLVNIGTGTWLNSVPKWLALFPQEWQDHMGEPDMNIRWHYGFWGQFINARGCFNARAAAVLRETGRMPYLRRVSYCSIKAMRAHLETL
ncbi:MAG: hypothetical protein IKA87_06325 [Lentisphaeria bacterium]|nr:hypothetical protein [Lentisphaeria bacterium]